MRVEKKGVLTLKKIFADIKSMTKINDSQGLSIKSFK